MRPRSQSCRMDCQGTGRDRTAPLPWLLSLAVCALWVAAGCEEVARNVQSRPKIRAAAQTGINVDIDVEDRSTTQPQAQPQPKPRPQQSGPIIGQRTSEIRNAAPELQKGNAQVASTKIVKKDPITIVGNAYVSIIGRTSVLNIQHAMDLYKAANDRYPKDYDEFMTEIIKANNISLPRLPPYQAYGYDEKEHQLILLEYPDKK
jgi:hypothetical protein